MFRFLHLIIGCQLPPVHKYASHYEIFGHGGWCIFVLQMGEVGDDFGGKNLSVGFW